MTRKELIVKSLQALTADNYFGVKTVADLTQVRQQAKLLGIKVKSKCLNGVYCITLASKLPTVEDYSLKPIGIKADSEVVLPTKNLNTDKYEQAIKHWEGKLTPVGSSGIAISGLAYYEVGWADIPEDWLVYEENLKTVFKPRFVNNPASLCNALTRSMNLPDTKIMLTVNYEPCEAVEAEERESLLNRTWSLQ